MRALLLMIVVLFVLSACIEPVPAPGDTVEVSNVALTSVSNEFLENENLRVVFDESVLVSSSAVDWRVFGSSIAALRFSFDTASDLTDASTNGNDGAFAGEPTWVEDCMIGGCYSFDGVDDMIVVPHDASLDVTNELSVSAWVKRSGDGQAYTSVIVGKNDVDEAKQEYSLGLASDNTIRFRIMKTSSATTTHDVYSTSAIPLNEWVHLVGIYDGTSLRLYLDGRLDNTLESSGTIRNDGNSLSIGAAFIGTENRRFPGSIDEVAVFSRVLSPEQIAADYAWNLDRLSSQVIVSQETNAGEVWSAAVIASDGSQKSPVVISDGVTILLANGTIAPICGNGIVESGEQCDDGSANGDTCTPDSGTCTYCTTTCETRTNTASDYERTYEQPSISIRTSNNPASGSSALRMGSSLRELHTSIHSVGFEWDLDGDEDHDAHAKVWYRKPGATSWKQAPDLFRVDWTYDSMWPDYDFASNENEVRQNRFAGSIMFLAPDTEYEVLIQISDPDGGSASFYDTVKTKPIPSFEAQRTRYVTPGSGGGSGTSSDPYRGLETALSAAEPGDDLRLRPGNYGKVQTDVDGTPNAFIRIISDTPHEAQLEQLKIYDADYLWVESMLFENYPEAGQTEMRQKDGRMLRDTAAIMARDSSGVVILDNVFDRYHHSVWMWPDGAREGTNIGWYIVKNRIEGDNHNQRIGYSLSGEGIELSKSRYHTVAFNTVFNTADAMSFPGKGTDVFGNHFYESNDDSIEPDLGTANLRIWGNRMGTAAEHSISFQPMIAGPWYFVRNEIINPEVATSELSNYPGPSKLMKYGGPVNRHVMWDNTVYSSGDMSGYTDQPFIMAHSRNTIYAFSDDESRPIEFKKSWLYIRSDTEWYRPSPEQYAYTNLEWMHDQDHDAFIWSGDFAEWLGTYVADPNELRSVAGFSADWEHNSIVARESDFRNYGGLDLRPSSSSRLIDAGEWIPGINDDYLGDAPDIGAHEYGRDFEPTGYTDAPLEELHAIWSIND